MQEPNKYAVLAFETGKGPAVPRVVTCVVTTPPTMLVIEIELDLGSPEPDIMSWTEVRIRLRWQRLACRSTLGLWRRVAGRGPRRRSRSTW